MDYEIRVKKFLIKNKTMHLTMSGVVRDEAINSHFLSKPKIVLHFFNGKEDRRIPFIIQNVTYIDGKCYFSGKYKYRLDLLFWKTRKEHLPFEMYLNLGFADYYEEKLEIDLTPEEFLTDDKYYGYILEGNHIKFLPDKRKIQRPRFL